MLGTGKSWSCCLSESQRVSKRRQIRLLTTRTALRIRKAAAMVYEQAIGELEKELAADRAMVAQKEHALALLVMLNDRRKLPICGAAPLVIEAKRRGAPVATETPAPTLPRVSDAADRDQLFQAVRTAVSRITDCEIRAADVYKRLEESGTHVLGKHPRQYVGAALDRLVDAGVLTRVTTGRGRIPNGYRHRAPANG